MEGGYTGALLAILLSFAIAYRITVVTRRCETGARHSYQGPVYPHRAIRASRRSLLATFGFMLIWLGIMASMYGSEAEESLGGGVYLTVDAYPFRIVGMLVLGAGLLLTLLIMATIVRGRLIQAKERSMGRSPSSSYDLTYAYQWTQHSTQPLSQSPSQYASQPTQYQQH